MKILTVAINTLKEAVRNKVLYTLLFFGVIVSGMSITLATMTVSSRIRVIANVSLANIEVFGVLIAIFVGISLVHKEIDRRTIFTIITRPLHRYEFILGKYIGLILTLLIQIAFMTLIFFCIELIFGGLEFLPDYLKAIWLIFVQIALITAVATMFSSLSSPILSGMFTLAFYIIGHISSFLEMLLPENANAFTVMLVTLMRYMLPDFQFLNVKGLAVYNHEIPFSYMAGATIYGFFYIAVILIIAMLVFEKRDMK